MSVIGTDPHPREFSPILRALSTARLEPGRLGASPVAVNLVWLVAHTTVKAKAPRTEVIHHGCSTAAIGCGDCKKMLAESLERELGPVRARADELRANPKRVLEILGDGGATCRARAAQTMREVKEAAGVRGAESTP